MSKPIKSNDSTLPKIIKDAGTLPMTNESRHLFNDTATYVVSSAEFVPFANVHRYPILSWFAKGLANGITSGVSVQAVPAAPCGFILALLPIYGL